MKHSNYTFTFLFDLSEGFEESWFRTIHANTLKEAWDHLIKEEMGTDKPIKEAYELLIDTFSKGLVHPNYGGDEDVYFDCYDEEEDGPWSLIKSFKYNYRD